jgi:hypothetical protein
MPAFHIHLSPGGTDYLLPAGRGQDQELKREWREAVSLGQPLHECGQLLIGQARQPPIGLDLRPRRHQKFQMSRPPRRVWHRSIAITCGCLGVENDADAIEQASGSLGTLAAVAVPARAGLRLYRRRRSPGHRTRG